MRCLIIVIALFIFAAGATACGKKGPPLPPLENAALLGR